MRTFPFLFVALGALLLGCQQDQNLGHGTGSGGSAGGSSMTETGPGGGGAAAGGGGSSASGGGGGAGGQAGAPPCAACEVLAAARVPTQIALDDDHVYWEDSGIIRSVSKGGGATKTLATKPQANGQEGLAIAGSTLYSSSPLAAPGPVPGVVDLPIGGGQLAVLSSGEPGPGPTYTTDVAISGALVAWGSYWDEDANMTHKGAVQTTPVGGGAPTTIYLGDPVWLLAADATNVFAATGALENPVTGNVLALPVAGGQPVILAPEFATSLAVDATDVYYWADGAVKKVSKGGGSPTTLATGSPGPIALGADDVYVASHDGAVTHVIKVSKGGGSPTPVATLDLGDRAFAEIAVDATHVYGVYDGTLVNGDYQDDGGVVRFPN